MSANGYVLSVVVGTLNRRERLRKCIDSILQNSAIPVRIYVSDAGSTDGTIEYLRTIECERIHVVYHGRKLGQAKAYNELFDIADTPYVCWLSDDNEVVAGGLDRAVQILDENPSFGMVGLKVKDRLGPFVGEPYIGGISEIGVLNVNQGVLRTKLLQSLGGFSEDFVDYGIDPDLTTRVLLSGHDVAYTRDVAILHYRDWGEADDLARQMAKQEKYKRLYREKYRHYLRNRHTYRALTFVARVVRFLLRAAVRPASGASASHAMRDAQNIVLGRFIGWNDPIVCRGKLYHLWQRHDRCRRDAAGKGGRQP